MVYYTAAQKAAYYKRKANSSRRAPARRAPARRAPARRAPTRRRTQYDYPGVGRKAGGFVGSSLGNMVFPGVGGMVGNALGSVVGQGAQALIKRVTGFGDYNVSKNSLVYNADAVPEFANNDRCTVINHREFITDVLGSTAFSIQSYRINPNISTTFPWLAGVASNYEQYVIQGMIFEFKTTCATAIGSTNTALGTVVMATQYNSLAQDFTNKQQMENYEFSQSAVPSSSIMHPIECDPKQTQCGGIFNMYNSSDQSGDTRLYDIGRFSIATVGMQAASTIGELWVTYRICLLKPRLKGVEEVSDIFALDLPTVLQAAPLGDVAEAAAADYNTGSVTLTSSTTLVIDPGFVGVMQIIYVIHVDAATTACTCPFMTPSGNLTDVTAYYTGLSGLGAVNSELELGGSNAPTGYTVQYFNCSGGFVPSSGLPPTVTFSNFVLDLTAGAVSNVRLICTAQPVVYP